MSKKRNSLYAVVLLLLVLCIAAVYRCTDTKTPAPIRLAITLPGTPVDTIRLYAFMAPGGEAITTTAILKSIYTLAMDELTATDADSSTYTTNLNLNETGTVRVVAVANPSCALVPGPSGKNCLRPGMTYGEFCNAVTLPLSHTPRTPLLMWGNADGTVTTDGITDMKIALTPSVARIDVVNNIRGFPYRIERISLVNAPSAAWLTPMAEGSERTGTPPGTPLLTQEQATIDLLKNKDRQVAYATQQITGELYCFPAANDDAATTVRLEIEGNLNGWPMYHTIAWEEGQPILPNRLYRVVIDGVRNSTINARILVGEWGEDGEIDYLPTAGMLTAEFTDNSGILYHTSANTSLTIITGTPDMDTKEPDEPLEMTFSVRITSDYTKAEVWKSHDWISYSDSVPTIDSEGRIVQEFTVTTVRIPGQEEGWIEFYNPMAPHEKVEYLFTDPVIPFPHEPLQLEEDMAEEEETTEEHIIIEEEKETKETETEEIKEEEETTSPDDAWLLADAWYRHLNEDAPGGQLFGISTNMLYWLLATPNLAMEIALYREWTLRLEGQINPFRLPGSLMGAEGSNPKLMHWAVRSELRYWPRFFNQRMFLGLHGIYGQFNVGGIPFIPGLKDKRYQGNVLGGGLTLGYRYYLSHRWNMEFSVSAGYLRMNYNRYLCGSCGASEGNFKRNYIGPTGVALSLIYKMK